MFSFCRTVYGIIIVPKAGKNKKAIPGFCETGITFLSQIFAEFTECRTAYFYAVGDDTFSGFSFSHFASYCFFLNCYAIKSSTVVDIANIKSPNRIVFCERVR